MDIEREMQKAHKVIFQNVQALDENRNEFQSFQGTLHDTALTSKRWRPKQRSVSLPDQKTYYFSMIAGKETTTFYYFSERLVLFCE